MSGTLLDMQDETREPIDYTHFDQWFNGEGLDGGDTKERIHEQMASIFKEWENTLDCTVLNLYDFSSSYEMVHALSFDMMMDLAIFNILKAGYDVYSGDNFIEIYARPEEAQQITATMNRAQQIVATTYCGGELNCPNVMDTLDTCGDGLFKYLMVELSDNEDCTCIDDAYNRVSTSRDQLTALLVELDKETTC